MVSYKYPINNLRRYESMAEPTLTCPHCGKGIPLTEALRSQIKEEVGREYEAKAREREAELKRREDELKKMASEIEDSKKMIEDTVSRRLAFEKPRLLRDAEARAKEELSNELKDLKEENDEKAKLLDEARKNELELRKKARDLEEEKKGLELEVARRLDAERENIRQSAVEMFSEEHRLKDLDKDKKIDDMRRMIEELKRKTEQGSVQSQGEVLEQDLEALLKASFPIDMIEPVPRGIKGADILQRVYAKPGQLSGTIAWELKRTKAWNDEWITKLKDDQRETKAEIAVLVTETLPRGTSSFTHIDGVWVTAIGLAGSLAVVLRDGLIQVAQSRLSAVGRGEKMEAIYNYLSGPEFRHRVEAIVESFRTMREDLEAEKRAMTKIWAKREKQMERVISNTSRMYGDMQGIIGATLPEIKSLELGSGAPEENE